MRQALRSLKRPKKCDGYGHSALVFGFVPEAILLRMIARWAAGGGSATTDRPKGYAAGKATTTPALKDVRIILPVTSWQALVYALLAHDLHTFIDASMTGYERPEFWEGGRPMTQTLDISHGLSLIIEKGLDNRSNAGISNSDIKQYYDHLDLQRITKYMEPKGMTTWSAKAILRTQAIPHLEITFGPEIVLVPPRSNPGQQWHSAGSRC